ncbi:tetrathionate reductase family octaheme c-type cytochrome [Myxococcota bacterium]|jgi:octaheme c-type cytochrome (tetrathionate reductase family)|nr:tetrathionate reductase family octaheme c-type cytochrome [Myxococcota bacterium]
MKTRTAAAWLAVVVAVAVAAAFYVAGTTREPAPEKPGGVVFRKAVRPHVDHGPFFPDPVASPQDVTRSCLRCHPEAARDLMKTAHWQWLGGEVEVPGHQGKMRIGKKNLLNNFCISIQGNWASCTKCHAGYGWKDDSFDFDRAENVDCLVCHERSGTYVKGDAGMPGPQVDLQAAARSVGTPGRENCSVCHSYGGGGQGVKHGDLDSSLENPTEQDDVHMGRLGFLCIDCHETRAHDIRGRAFSVSVEGDHGVACEDCHREPPHRDRRLDAHLDAVACQTCHIPTYARRLPTKVFWDWSKAGDPDRQDDPHRYLRIKGEFLYDQDVVPEYAWFNRTVERYLLGDPVDPATVTDINRPRGDIRDRTAKIWPFKVHRAIQQYDAKRLVLLPPVTGGEGGFWHDFDWDKAIRLGAKIAGIEYSGEYGWTRTAMYWPLSHMVAPKDQALRCDDCHGERSRMDWKALGYEGDPMETGGRR